MVKGRPKRMSNWSSAWGTPRTQPSGRGTPPGEDAEIAFTVWPLAQRKSHERGEITSLSNRNRTRMFRCCPLNLEVRTCDTEIRSGDEKEYSVVRAWLSFLQAWFASAVLSGFTSLHPTSFPHEVGSREELSDRPFIGRHILGKQKPNSAGSSRVRHTILPPWWADIDALS